MKRKNTNIVIGVKKEIIAKHENGVRVSDLATQFGMAKSMICTVLKNRETIKKADVARGVTVITKQRSQMINPLTPNDDYSGRTAPLSSKCCILYIYSTNTGTEYFKHGIYSPFFPLQNAVCFVNLTYLVPVLFTFYIQVC